MKIEYLESCTTNRLTVDGIYVENMSIEEKSNTIKAMIDKAIEESKCLGTDGYDVVIKDLLNVYGNMEFDDESCEQCGHTTSTTTMEI